MAFCKPIMTPLNIFSFVDLIIWYIIIGMIRPWQSPWLFGQVSHHLSSSCNQANP
ncbi:hypothetical protein BDW69DRAFT_167989 [Aspergillus filifer]